MLLGVRNVKTTYWNSWPENLFQVWNLTFVPASTQSGVIILKCPHIFLIIGPQELQIMKTAHRKSC